MTTTTDITIVDQLLEDGPLTVKELTTLLGKAETTVRNVLKGLLASSIVTKVEGSKPAAYTLAPTEVDETEVAEQVDELAEVETEAPIVEEDEIDESAEAEAKLDEILAAVTAVQLDPPKKIKKSRKVCNTDVPDEHNFTVKVNDEFVSVTAAYPYLLAVPTFASLDELFEYAEIGKSRTEGDHSMHEVAALYYVTVANHLEFLLDSGLITRPVWYGRTCRLRHKVFGHGRGTALTKPVVKISDK